MTDVATRSKHVWLSRKDMFGRSVKAAGRRFEKVEMLVA